MGSVCAVIVFLLYLGATVYAIAVHQMLWLDAFIFASMIFAFEAVTGWFSVKTRNSVSPFMRKAITLSLGLLAVLLIFMVWNWSGLLGSTRTGLQNVASLFIGLFIGLLMSRILLPRWPNTWREW